MAQHRGRTITWFASVLAAVAIGGCQDTAAPGPRVTGVQVARNVSQVPEVTGTDPTGAPQDTTLDVEVFGSGFDNGSTVELTLSGVPTEKVHTNSTRYRNSRTLIANITIAADAQVDFYDVEVTTASRKKGIGSEMFEVFTGGGNQIMVEFVRPASADLAGFFGGATLDFSSAPQAVEGKINENSIQTKSTSFTLQVEPATEFLDGRDPSDPSCGMLPFLETLLTAAAANGGYLTGSLEITAQWDHPITTVLGVHFMVAVGDYEYDLGIPQGGDAGSDRIVRPTEMGTMLAMRNGHFDIRRRELGRKGTWWEINRCYVTSDPPNGLVEFEIMVTR